MFSILHDDPSGSTAPMEFLFVAPLSPLCHRVSFMFGESKGSVSVELVHLDSALREERSWHLFTHQFLNSSNLCHTAQNGREVRRGYDRHLHGQRLVPPEGT